MKEGEWRFWSRGRILFHKFFGLLHEFWSGEPLFADGSNRMRGQFKMDKGGLAGSHVRVSAPSWHKGASAPTENDVGLFHTLVYDAGHDDEVHYTLLAPFRMKAGTDIVITVKWTYTGAQDNGTLHWACEYICVGDGETVDGSTTTTTITTAGNHPTGKKVTTKFTTGIIGAAADDDIGIHLYRDFSEDTLNADAELISVHFRFTMDKLGEHLSHT